MTGTRFDITSVELKVVETSYASQALKGFVSTYVELKGLGTVGYQRGFDSTYVEL